MEWWLAGSSPLARGLRHGMGQLGDAERIIPARAGFTCMLSPLSPETWDHPRSRGVYASVVVEITPLRRIIPARAGFTQQQYRAHACSPGSSPLARGLLPAGTDFGATVKDHPRSRGVYGRRRSVSGRRCGSSPLARGLRAEIGDIVR